MKILVANLGSTSFKYSLFDMDGEKTLARGRVERIGEAVSPCTVQIGDTKTEIHVPVPDHAVAVRQCLAQLTDTKTGCLADASEVSAIGFKAVLGGKYSGIQRVTKNVLDSMEELNDVMPAHNPPYVRAMRLLAERLPDILLVAAFETGFHQTIPDRNRYYGVPKEWAEKYFVVRWGFHGASHRYIAERTAEIFHQNDLRIISCHLGGSSSLCAIHHGKSVAASMGTSSQTGVFHNNRVGDFDPFIVPYLMQKLGKTQEELLTILATQSGLLGLSGVSGDLRDVTTAADNGNLQAKLALDVLIGDIRKYLGAYLVELGGADVIVFTGGIGEYQPMIRQKATEGLEQLGIVPDAVKNKMVLGVESPIHAESSRTHIWVIPTNEEIIVARQTKEMVEAQNVK
ncbi:MAG: acetate/propionate family kinase [Planctomycetaceae bacterium]|jgi:acetate kinase|nr:acetate/propionate family kinase [Planctomycetaceae bacterium]